MPEQRPPAQVLSLAAPLLAVACLGVAATSFLRVIAGFGWLLPVLAPAVALVLLGALLRWLCVRARPLVRIGMPLGAQLLLLIGVLTAMFARSTAFWAVIPTVETGELLAALVREAVREVWFSHPPLGASIPLTFVLTTAFGLFAIAVELLLAYRRVVVAALLVALIGAVPIIGIRAEADVAWFALLGILTLVLLYHGRRLDVAAPRPSPLWLTALVGTLAIGGALVLGPGVPIAIQLFAIEQRVALSTTLNLGQDLRRPEAVTVISLATAADTAPYLRLATLTRLEGQVWHTDDFVPRTLGSALARRPLPEGGELLTTSMRIQGVDGQVLPVPYPAVGVHGMEGQWRGMVENRTVVTTSANANDQDYTAVSLHFTPTLEEMRADRAGGDIDEANWQLPDDLPAQIASLAREVTAEAETDFDKLLALQSWFRTQFRYSLDAPVQQGFDGSGAEAVGAFLEVREGYCVHFAAAFTLMARTLGMPARIVVGFLPGTPTGGTRGDEKLYAVSTDQLHAWPEVHFEQWGWVPFEPTTSRGTPNQPPTEAELEGEEGESSTGELPPPTTPPDPTDPDLGSPETPLEPGLTPTAPVIDRLPALLVIAALVLLGSLPAVIRLLRRRSRLRRAADGDALAAWLELDDTCRDLDIPLPATETIRARGARLVRRYRAPAVDVQLITDAAERAHYAKAADSSGDLGRPLRRVLKALHAHDETRGQLVARLLPRSLFGTARRESE